MALFTHFVLLRAPITTDFSSWHAMYGLWHLGVLLTIGLGACYLARYGQGAGASTLVDTVVQWDQHGSSSRSTAVVNRAPPTTYDFPVPARLLLFRRRTFDCRIGVPSKPNSSRSWFTRNRS